MRIAAAAGDRLAAGLAAIREQYDIPRNFTPEVLAAADEAASRRPGAGHVDRTDVAFVTLDPASATDLDQAFAIETAGPDLLLHYAIADVGFFVDPGGPLEATAWERGTTTYLPDEKVPLYPPVLSEGAASLLPDGPRPAVVFAVRIDRDGNAVLDGAERALIHSRAKLAYDAVGDGDLPDGFAELSRRIVAAEDRRGAPRVEFPEQRLERTEHGWRLSFDVRSPSEDQNAGMSLAANLAVAAALHAARTGLFRVMPEVSARAAHDLRRTAVALGLTWPDGMSLAQFQRSLAGSCGHGEGEEPDQRAAAFLLAVRRASGGASYEPYRDGTTPWHSAMAATYAHATAPLRRLADRYVVEGALAVANGGGPSDHLAAAYEALPATMARAEQRAGQVDSAVDNLAEATVLSGREGEVFDGVIVDDDGHGAVVQIAEPAILARVQASRVDPGDAVRVKLLEADPETRRVEFQRVG